MEKAKYIKIKEESLLKDLDRSYKKLKEIANWYSLSFYSCNSEDYERQIEYIQKINNIYHEMKSLIISSKNTKILNYYERLIIEDKLKSLERLKELQLSIEDEQNKKSREEYPLNFHEAIDLCLNSNKFIVGENFEKGHYVKNLNGVIVVMSINNGFAHEIVDNLMITNGLLSQNFKTVVCVNKKTIGSK